MVTSAGGWATTRSRPCSLSDGLSRTAGRGDVQVWTEDPEVQSGEPAPGRRRTYLRLTSPNGTALLSMHTEQVVEFLEQSQRMVAFGAEPEQLKLADSRTWRSTCTNSRRRPAARTERTAARTAALATLSPGAGPWRPRRTALGAKRLDLGRHLPVSAFGWGPPRLCPHAAKGHGHAGQPAAPPPAS
ncbi:SsgA family sporulation/cell division regulator [Streptomyces sp. NPDC006326]|uniref:SsgA family sporulation/cell division regulator n=1 Tax=Streptomyces sp. NPDC006326 TaxID=3156752 RepID=UPI0033AAE3D6